MKSSHSEMQKLGDVLKRARIRKNISIDQAAESTKIRLEYLEGIENSEYQNLPAEVYTKGFIRNYSMYLGLNPDVMLALHRRENDSKKHSKLTKIKQPKKEGFSFNITQEKLIIGVVVVLISFFLIYIFSRVNSVLQPPEFALVSPIEASIDDNQVYRTDEETISIRGTLEVGSKLKFNGVDFDTRNLGVFEIPDIRLNEGENVFDLTATNDFGIESKIVLKVIREPSGEPQIEETEEGEIVSPTENMLIEIIIGPNEANLKVTIDGIEVQNKVESPGVKTYRAKSSVKIQTPRPTSVRVAINGEEKTLNTGNEVEWVFLDGSVVQR